MVGVAVIAAAVAAACTPVTVVSKDWMLYQFWVKPYYQGFAGVVAGRESLATWQHGFDLRVASDEGVTAWIRDHHLERTRTVVWSSDAWPYLTDDLPLLLRTAPIYNDEVLLGQNGPVADRVAQLDPKMIVTASYDTSQFPEIEPLLHQRYHLVFRSGVDSVWLRDGTTVPQGP